MTQHMDKHFEEELEHLKGLILRAGGIVEAMMADAMRALVSRDSDAAQAVIGQDSEMNRLEMAIDDYCLRLLALRQPAGSDLRFITMGIRISKDLERMGDLAVNIAEQALILNRVPQLKPYTDLPAMADKAQKMVQQVLRSFVEKNAGQAQQVCEMDDAVDDLNSRISEELIEIMKKENEAVERSVHLILVARHLERIADHATNIAEEVIYMVKGKDIRHGQG